VCWLICLAIVNLRRNTQATHRKRAPAAVSVVARASPRPPALVAALCSSALRAAAVAGVACRQRAARVRVTARHRDDEWRRRPTRCAMTPPTRSFRRHSLVVASHSLLATSEAFPNRFGLCSARECERDARYIPRAILWARNDVAL
jgi:hypothetical protein